MGAALAGIGMLPMPVYASSPEAILRQVFMQFRHAEARYADSVPYQRLSCSPRSIARKKTFSWPSTLDIFCLTGKRDPLHLQDTSFYQRRKTMALSDLQILETLYHSSEFSGKNVLPLLVADYMPQAKVFLYDENLYPKALLGWSGRNPDSTFVVGGYQCGYGWLIQGSLLGPPSYHLQG